MTATPIPEKGKPKRDINLIRKEPVPKNRFRIIHDCASDCFVSYSSRQLQTFEQWYGNIYIFYSHELNFSELNPTFTKTSKGLKSSTFLTVCWRVRHKTSTKTAQILLLALRRKSHTWRVSVFISHGQNFE